ncbi:MAG: PEGA domain-containing protein [Patescibacteria group bacterium]
MTLLYRRLVYSIFIIIFLIVTPLVILYAEGYRYNFQKGRVQKTGILIISSLPKKAEVYLNEKKIDKQKTNAKIEYILPGDYEIKLVKEGYHNWQKKLPICENLTTFAEKIILWKNSQPQKISTLSSTNWQESPSGKKTALLNDNFQLEIFDQDNEKLSTTTDLKTLAPLKISSWSPSEHRLLLTSTGPGDAVTYIIVNLDNKKIQKIINQKYQKIKWSPGNDNVLYAQNNTGLWQIDLDKKTAKILIAKFQADDFIIRNGQVYYFHQQKIYNQKLNASAARIVTDKIKCPGCQINDRVTSKIILLNQQTQNLVIVSPDQSMPNISAQAKDINWLNDDTILFYNDWEIYIYNFNKKDPELITRFGQPISQAVWHPQGRHLIFASDNKLRVIELDNRELRNIIDLASNTPVQNLQINSSGKTLYFFGQVSNESGVYKLAIQ